MARGGGKRRTSGGTAAPPPKVAAPSPADELDFDEPNGASFPIVGVGASAGGLEAFTQLLKALPADTGMAFVLVQHLAPSHPSALAEILSRATRMPVVEVRDEPAVEPNHVYVMPPDRSMIIAGGALQLLPREGRGAHHPVDQFFRSLAKEQRHQSIGVVLSGTATDGTIGLDEIKAEGGITFAQDSTAQHEGMPHSAIASGSVDFVLPPDEIAREIARIGRHAYAVPEAEARETDDKPNLAAVVKLLHHATGVDFTGYKFNTLYRRVTRRMVFRKIDGLAEYVQFLRQTPAEIDALYQDILISVTSFFRDKESFEALKATVFNRLLKDRSKHDPVRLWTLGCSTGQESYSLAMAFAEAAEAAGSSVPLQIFASDLNAAGIEKARAGVYPKDIAQDVSPERLRRFFTEVDGHYRVTKSIRDVCVFSRHNVLADPPFSRIDLISCRNLLIYLEPVLQQRLMPTLHYALKPAGCLWLGGSETIGGYRNLFDSEDAKHKIYSKKPGSGPGHGVFALQHGGRPRPPFTPIGARPSDGADLYRDADRLLSTKFAPPGVLVTTDLDILQYRGDTGPYLAPVPGKASLNLLKMLREGLLVAVRAAILRAGNEQAPVREEGLRVKSNGGHREIAVEVIPLKGGFLVLFDEPSDQSRERQRSDTDAPPVAHASGSDTADSTRLEQELAATREYLQSVIEQQEAANEELQSANEEVQSANEELQSTNEELETSKEEIQSSNEELATVNDELNNRNAELHRVNDDLVNLVGSVNMAIVILGPDLRVRRYTPISEKLLNLSPTDVGRPMADIKLNLDDLPDLEPLLAEVLETVSVRECEVRDKQGRWYSLRLRPYKTLDNKIDGVVAVLVDVDAMKRVELLSAHLAAIVTSSDDAIVGKDLDGTITSWNKGAEHLFGYTAEEAIGQPVTLLIPPDRIDEEPGILERIRRGEAVEHYETVRRRKDGSLIDISLTVSPVRDAGGRVIGAAKIARDTTGRKRVEEALVESEQRFRILADSTPALIWVNGREGCQFVNRQYLEFLGVENDAVHGYDWSQFIHPEDRENYVEAYLRAMDQQCDFEAEFRFRRHDGEYRWMRSEAQPRRGRNDEFLGFAGLTIDITERQQAEEQLRRNAETFSKLVDQAPFGIYTVDSEFRITEVSAGAQPAFRNVRPLIGRDFGEAMRILWPEPFATEVVDNFRRTLETGEPYLAPSLTERRRDIEDVESYEWQIHRVMLPDGHYGIVCYFFDATRLRHTEEQLRQSAAEMSEADHRKDEFLAMLAHELRNPLAPVRNALEILRLAASRNTEAPAVDHSLQLATAMMERQVGQMVRLVDDLLDVSRISRGKIELRRGRIELSSIIYQAVEASRPALDAAGHELTVTVPPQPVYLFADPVRLAQVVGNLLNNAGKFSETGGRISLTVAVRAGSVSDGTTTVADASGSEIVEIRVKDSGIGIAAEELLRVFEMFTQLNTSLDRTQGGLGIGLSLVKNLVEMHDGAVEVHSAGIGHGSEFVVRLPLPSENWRKNEEPDSDPASRPSPLAAPRRILVVDDNRDSATTLAMLLELSGHKTRTAFDGLEAMKTAEEFRPEVMLLDIGLPKLNGYEVARRIREQAWGKGMVLVALTGWGQVDDRQKSREAGFNAHLVKPVDHAALANLLAEMP